jgi:putative ABC transport system ATP-binding protein
VTVLELQNVVFRLRGQQCSPGVSLALPDGGAAWVRGRSGQGKTTLLRTIARLVPLWEGEMLLQGTSWKEIPAPSWRTRVTYIHQKSALFPGSVVSNLERAFTFKSHSSRRLDQSRANAYLLDLLLPDDILTRDALTLSVGEAARVAVVRALMVEPQVLLLDEPTAALDARAIHALASLLRRWLSSSGRGIIAASHDPEIAKLLPGPEIELGPGCEED